MTSEDWIKLAPAIMGVVNLLVSTGLWLYVRSSTRHEKIDERFAQLQSNVDERLDSTGERLARLEERVQHSPTHDDVGRVYDRINLLATGMSEIKGAVDNLSVTMRQFMSRIIEKGMP